MRRRRKILIVDDEPDVIEFLSYNFRKNEFDVIGANNGTEGIEMAKREMPDVIIADILMPNMNGITMCKILKNNTDCKHIPILFLSATQDDYQVLHATLSGDEHYISKPVLFPILLNMVNEIINEEMDD